MCNFRAVLLLAFTAASGAFAAEPAPPLADRIAAAAKAEARTVAFDGSAFSGPGWEFLVREGAQADFFLLGEEHGIAENPKFAGALFRELTKSGYSKFAIEVSPPMAAELDRAALDGEEGLRALFAKPGGAPAFFTMKEEAEMLVGVRASAPKKAPVLWGLDYEVGGDRVLIARLMEKKKPAAAETALDALKAASDASWAEYEKTRNPQFIFSFSGDPALVAAVRDAWPRADAEARQILHTLEETFAVNRLWIEGKALLSNERRARLLRRNFLDYWSGEHKAPKVFAKFGASHMVRGRSYSEVFDLGALLPEIAELSSKKSFSLLVLPGAGASTAVLNPATFRYESGPPRNDYANGLEAIAAAADQSAFTVIDLRPLRPIVGWKKDASSELRRAVHGFDAVLILSGSTPSSNFSE